MARTVMPWLYGGEIATDKLAHPFERCFVLSNLLDLRLPQPILEVWISSNTREEANL
jgi:hypothetical protein